MIIFNYLHVNQSIVPETMVRGSAAGGSSLPPGAQTLERSAVAPMAGMPEK